MHRRTQYVIARAFQLKFSLILTAIGVLVAAIVGVILYGVLVKTQSILIGTGVVTSPEVIDYLMGQRRLYLYSIGSIFVGVTILLMAFGIMLSHRLAGPIFALSRKMNDLAQGNFNAMLKLRKGDEFQDVKDKFNTLVQALQNQVKSELIKIEAVMKSLEALLINKDAQHNMDSDIRNTLRDLQSYYLYKKNLIEPLSSQSYQPKKATDEEILL